MAPATTMPALSLDMNVVMALTAISARSGSVRPASDVFLQRHPAGQRPVDVPVRVGRNALLRPIRIVGDERGDLAVADAPDPDALGEAGIRLRVRLVISHVERVVAIDEDTA